MSMYSQILTEAIGRDEDSSMSLEALKQVVEHHHTKVLEDRKFGCESAEIQLANEVAYDRALIRLCVAIGIETNPDLFSYPRAERERLEQNLADAGLAIGSHPFS
jgi:hypothetical protein